VGGVKLPLALAELVLIDAYEFVVQPRLAGHGPTLFAGRSKYVDLKLVSRLEFASGAVAMQYEPRRVGTRSVGAAVAWLGSALGLGHGDLLGGLMADDPMYHHGMRQLQDARETRPLADRLEQVTVRTAFTDEDRAFIERCPMFFIATAVEHSVYAPRPDYAPPAPAWKTFDDFRDYVPARDRAGDKTE
jgi:hypothetical protein